MKLADLPLAPLDAAIARSARRHRRQPQGQARRPVRRDRRRQGRRRAFRPRRGRRRRGGGRRRAAAGRRCPTTSPSCRSPTRAARWRCCAAAFFPRQPQTIAAVTGTSGKTSVAAFTRQIWAALGMRRQASARSASCRRGRSLRLADHARSGRPARTPRRARRRGRHASGARSLLPRPRPAPARRRAHRGRRLHQSVARPSRLSSDHRGLSRRQAAAVRRR